LSFLETLTISVCGFSRSVLRTLSEMMRMTAGSVGQTWAAYRSLFAFIAKYSGWSLKNCPGGSRAAWVWTNSPP
jgi:hypothetical protein